MGRLLEERDLLLRKLFWFKSVIEMVMVGRIDVYLGLLLLVSFHNEPNSKFSKLCVKAYDDYAQLQPLITISRG